MTGAPALRHVGAMFTAPPTIETDRLRLRPTRFSDKDVHIAMWADARVTRFIGGEPRARSNRELWAYVALAALLLLGVEWWVFHRGV